MLLIVLLEYIVDLCVGDLATVLSERQFKVFSGDLACVIDVQGVENTSEMAIIFTKHFLDI